MECTNINHTSELIPAKKYYSFGKYMESINYCTRSSANLEEADTSEEMESIRAKEKTPIKRKFV